MKLAWTLGRVFGIPVRLHFTIIILPFIIFEGPLFSDIIGIIVWLTASALLIGSVLLHELGHALTARRFGIDTQDIILTPIGGIARIVKLPDTPKQEIAIALAGPLVSLILAAAAFALLPYVALWTSNPGVIEGFSWIFNINIVLSIFNLIPALPMDGGRVLRGILALRRDHLSATRIAVKVGRTIAVLGVLGALFWSTAKGSGIPYNIVFIGGFIYLLAGNELRHAEIKAVRERMAREAARGEPSSRQPWPWSVYGRQAEEATSRSDKPRAVANTVEPEPQASDGVWNSEDTSKNQRNVMVVKGGKVEILSRKDPKTK